MSDPTARPIFIGGCPRSGTTLLADLIGRRNNCLILPEAPFISELSSDGPGMENAVRMVRKIEKNRKFRIWNNKPNLEKLGVSEYSSVQEFWSAFVRSYAESMGYGEYSYWVDHTPANIRRLCSLLEVFPEARVIHIVRDGRAVVNSVLKLDWGPNTPKYASRWWLQNLSFGLAAENRWPDRVERIAYEDLVRSPEASLTDLEGSFGLSSVEGSGLEFDLPSYTKAQHLRVRGRPDPSRIDAWKGDLSERHQRICEFEMAEILSYLGYDQNFNETAYESGLISALYSDIKELALKGINLLKYRWRAFKYKN